MDKFFMEIVDKAFQGVEKFGIINTMLLLFVVCVLYLFGRLQSALLQVIHSQQNLICDMKNDYGKLIGLEKEAENVLVSNKKASTNDKLLSIGAPIFLFNYTATIYNLLIYFATIYLLIRHSSNIERIKKEVSEKYSEIVFNQRTVKLLQPFSFTLNTSRELESSMAYERFDQWRNIYDIVFIRGTNIINVGNPNHSNAKIKFALKGEEMEAIFIPLVEEGNVIGIETHFYQPKPKKFQLRTDPVVVNGLSFYNCMKITMGDFVDTIIFICNDPAFSVSDKDVYVVTVSDESFVINGDDSRMRYCREPLGINESYVLKTHNSKYVKIKVSNVTQGLVEFDYIIQLDGTKEFSTPLLVQSGKL